MIDDLTVVTGGAGFIGSNLVEELGRRGRLAVVIDDFGRPEKWNNLRHANIQDLVEWTAAFDWLDRHADRISSVVHLGARSSTTTRDLGLLLAKNVNFSNSIWAWCAYNGKPLVYASSAATYGDGSLGFSDTMTLAELERLRPLNPYGWSKHLVDLRVLRSVAADESAPPAWYGVKFFNVYGPHEHHKADMRSVALKLHETVTAGRQIELFRSHRADIRDGMQLRDFVHVGDCVDVLLWLLAQRPASGLYNIGTGHAESFLAVAEAVAASHGGAADVKFIDMPAAIRERYQYFTQADMSRLRAAGYNGSFRSVAQGVSDYMQSLATHPDA